MPHDPDTPVTAFRGPERIDTGPLRDIARRHAAAAGVLVFDDRTGQVIDPDPRGYPDPPRRGPGRPKLGVIPREVTLLQRHWDWLARQKGGASAALRRLVDEARRADAGETDARAAQEAVYRFLQALGGDFPGYEDAMRALFSGKADQFDAAMTGWPADMRNYAMALMHRTG